MTTRRPWLLLGILLCLPLLARAGGPLLVGSPAFGVDGQPFVWNNATPIGYRVDTGALGPMSNATALQTLQAAFSTWTGVPTVALSVTNLGPILGPAGGHVATVADFDSVVDSCNNGDQSPMIFDSAGTLFAQLIGDASVVGFTSPCQLSRDGHIHSALSVFTGGAGLSGADQDKVMLHELGHFFGLDHSLPGTDPCGTGSADIASLPIMFFQLNAQTTLASDDKAWISKLYPGSTFSSVYGTLSGQVLFSDGQSPVQDVLVSAHPAAAGTMAGEDRSRAWSVVSGYRFTGNPGQSFTANYLPCTVAADCPHGYYGNNVDGGQFGSRNPVLLGSYEIPVPAGSYAVEVSGLSDGGTIGPLNPVFPPPGPGEYWNPNESASDPDFSQVNCSVPQSLSYVAVTAGQTTPNINIILNGTAPTFDIFEGPNAAGASVSRPEGQAGRP